ncbi:uncharacterized protein BO87DRAFT_46767 [Aspergillus neoniger CBS 115656]|uniref:Uncharacterized protein n=1 Tax=Aspergillus neoniger (strain CBS 115656) TaxID=1448310 RepID=A0A318YKQ6_ASPNB|nr:hypothetical protein BO87DRAFT_46767 [Aspergillus neoniger CBS 115656]PYH34979.1 hypothetical protein BO87DRAFT_46767 [Aspergillus neoniger CBS 115656]
MNDPAPSQDDPQQRTSQRMSYQAPTRASLARSHPILLETENNKSPAKTMQKPNQARTRALGLRDRKALRPSLTSTASPLGSLKGSKQSPASSLSGRRSSGLAAFAAPPRRVSTRITASDLVFRSPSASQQSTEKLPPPTDTPENQLASELDSATGDIDANEALPQPSFQDILDEPDLPPTPTQLGLERPPGRPKGLLSSSPSSQQGKWGKRRNTDGREQSPSKLRKVDYGEAGESADSGLLLDRTSLPEEILTKRKLKNKLASELQQLRNEISELETWSKDLAQDEAGDERGLTGLITLLTATNPPQSTPTVSGETSISSLISSLLPFATKGPPKPPPEAPPVNPFALGEHAQTEAYLTALAPLQLTAYSETIPNSTPNLVLERHTLQFSAPPPFPSNRYKVSVTCDVNPETQSLVSISFASQANGEDTRTPEDLRRWIDTRLANPLLKLDVTGLCWGINRYWEAMVSRAELWLHMEEQHAELISGHAKRDQVTKSKSASSQPLGMSELRQILPHLERTSMLFESKSGSPKVLVSCQLTLDEWTSEPQLAPGLSVSLLSEFDSGSRRKVDQESKRLFQSILNPNENNQAGSSGSGVSASTILRATDCVLRALLSTNSKK